MRLTNVRVLGTLLLCLVLGSLGVGAVSAQADCPNFADPIGYGDEVSGEIDDSDVIFFYCFEAQEGDEIVIDAETTDGDLDPYLLLSDLDVEEFYAENDNASSRTLDSQIEFTIEDDNTYIIAITRKGAEEGDTEGEYTLRLEGEGSSSGNSGNSGSNTASGDTGQCPVGSNMLIAGYGVTANIDDDSYLRSYCFFGVADSEYRITVETTQDDLDPIMIVASLDLEDVFADNDNANSRTTDARIDFVPEADGVYLVLVSRKDLDEGDTAGEYLISLDNRTTDEPDMCADELSFPADGVEIGAMDQTFLHVYCFNGNEDDEVTFTAEAQRGDLDMIAFITDPSQNTVEQSESQNESMELTATLSEDGPYLVMVFDLTGEGNFDMTLEGGAGSGSSGNNGEENGNSGSGGTLNTIFGNNGGDDDPEPSGDCGDEPLSFLVEGDWSSTSSTGTTEMKFDCDGNVTVTVNGNAFETSYTLKNDTLTLELDDGDLVVEGILLTRTALIGTSEGQAFMLLNRSR